ncbi:TonB-dependent receptor plug domain-containing protein [Dokdonia sp.]|uniref:TonB-dependent receptor plug domain-containing protein n=1 Tax=Dokdonia sp. TaxID=2024995 RepID=UPI0032640438
MIKKHIYFWLFLCISTITLGQEKTIEINEVNYIEKIYTHTDRSFYFPGETIWFKTYITNAHQNITSLSDVVYVELISPEGNSIQKANYRIENGYTYGQFELNNDWVGGIYTIKAYTQWMLNYGDTSLFSKKITVQKIVEPRLQMKFDFKKEAYGPGSNVQASLILKDLENNPLKNKECTYTVSIAGQRVSEQNIISNNDGELSIRFSLPDSLDTTDVIINVLIPHLGSNESISRSIPVTLDNIDLQFLPESGVLLENHKNTIAFKAINAYGKPADISGIIKNSTGDIVVHFDSFHNGMGSFELTPRPDEQYTAHIYEPFKSKSVYKIPKAQKHGISIHLDKMNEEQVTFTITSSENKEVEWCVSDVKQTLYNDQIHLKKGSQSVTLNTSTYPQGITKFTIQTLDDQYTSERLVFINYDRKLSIDITTNKDSYTTREQIEVDILTKDQHGNPVPSNLSLAVVDNKLLSFADDRQDHIASYLLMSSELKGTVYKPNFYFNPKEDNAQKALDYVLLTHGWRSYITEKTKSIQTAQYPPESFSIQSGVIVNKKGTPTPAKLLLFDINGDDVLPFKTNDKGVFFFKIEDGKEYTLLAYNDNGEKLIIKSNNSNNSYDWQVIEKQRNKDKAIKKQEELLKKKLTKPTAKPIIKKAIEKEKIASNDVSVTLASDNQLSEVIVTAQGIVREKKALGYAVSEVSSDEIGSRAEGDVGRILSGKASGIAITSQSGTSGNATNVVIRGANSISGSNQPLFIIDGVPYTNETSIGIHQSIDIDPNNVESINILKGITAATLYGTAGRNGVIVITTKGGNYRSSYKKKKINNSKYRNYTIENFSSTNYRNYTPSKRFYVPLYDHHQLDEERTDFRQTIYWNPIIQTDEHGKATLTYHNSDAITSFNIIAEGISATGEVGRTEKSYNVINPITIDYKTPAYLSVDDEVALFISIRNNTEQPITGTLSMELPEEIRFINTYAPQKITIDPKSFTTVQVPIRAFKKAKNIDLKALFISDTHSDFLTTSTTIISPYFPTEASLSGFKNKSFELAIDNAVSGSMSAEFNLYTDIVGEVMDGIASLIRKPYGCFEQTSSSTYPNIMVLKYLRESGKSNPEIEAKALDFIKQGYKRLISFETKEGGFEWFGHTPPHETLTAFGVLEFTEMKEVYPKVSDEMITRTIQWLMDRRDGKGGFHKSKKGYDSFASSPQDVANAYIVYALSEAGIAVDIQKEYEVAYKDALKSNDSYKIALMACASFNLNQIENATRLLQQVKLNIETHGFNNLPVKNTITRSYGNDKQTETLAFTILALLKEQNQDPSQIDQAVEHLLNNRKHGRFGATQATAMALKALIEYTKTQKSKLLRDNDLITININGQTSEKKLITSPSGKISIDGLEKSLKKGINTIDVLFSDAKKQFPYSLDITWDSTLPESAIDCPLELSTTIMQENYKVGDIIRHNTTIKNSKDDGLGMVTAIIGIPSGASVQPWQLKELIEKNKIAFYEVYDNYVIFYWRSFKNQEEKTIHLDLKAEVPGTYIASASSVYLYYGEEYKHWIKGTHIKIEK